MQRKSRKQRKQRKQRKSRKQQKSRKQRKSRRSRVQRGGGFAYDIPPGAIVTHQSMEDGGFQTPRLVQRREIDPENSERA